MRTRHTRTVGLLVVHGIGEQKRLATAGKVVAGLKRAVPGLIETKRDEATACITVREPSSGTIVHLYEVYWADLLSGPSAEGAFAPEMMQAVAWFPWLNLRCGMYRGRPGMLVRVLLWTAALVPLTGLVYLGLIGVRLLAAFFPQARADLLKALRAVEGGTFTQRYRAVAEAARTVWLDHVLDQVVGDIFSYARGSLPGDPWPTAADGVRLRFYEQARRARQDGCDEVDALAHSLGTVVAFHALTGYRLSAEGAPHTAGAIDVARVWTIGSPLDKFAFLWPVMTGGEPATRTPTWVNFSNPLDVVAGRLDAFHSWHVENRRVWSGGAGRAHTIYERNPRFLGSLTEELFGTAMTPPRRSWHAVAGFAEAVVESATVILAFLFAAAVGALLFGGSVALLPWLVSSAAGLFVSDDVQQAIWNVTFFVQLALMTLILLLIGPRIEAGREHLKWRPTPAGGK